ncbi:kinase-like domain-containing protein, partial [Gigaspora rosea]
MSVFANEKSNDDSNQVKGIYGVLPYVAPEVLEGKPYTMPSDIYSFGIIMWELASGRPAHCDRPHDVDLQIKIIKGLRPYVYKDFPPCYSDLMTRCWDSDPNKRPKASEILS